MCIWIIVHRIQIQTAKVLQTPTILLDKCWFGRDDYETLSVEDYLSNQLSRCCKTKDGGTPLDLTLKERVFSRIRNGFFIESGGQDGFFKAVT